MSYIIDPHLLFIRKPVGLYYVYSVPDDAGKCYKFTVSKNYSTHVLLACVGCTASKRKLPSHENRHILHRKSEDLCISEDPAMHHIKGCEPIEFEKDLDGFETLKIGETKGKQKFPLKLMQKSIPSVVYRLKDDPSKCYYTIRNFRKDKLYVVCRGCAGIYGKAHREKNLNKRDNFRGYFITPSEGIEEPHLGHLSECQPLLFEESMEGKHILDEEQVKRMFKKNQDEESESSENRTGVAELHFVRSNSVFTKFVYFISDEMTKCYIFRCNYKARLKASSMSCLGCEVFRKQKKDISYRKSDGLCMFENPALNHVEGCEPMDYSKATKGYEITKKEGIPQNTDFPLTLMQKSIIFIVYRLNDSDNRCYIFNISKWRNKCVSLSCAGCNAAYSSAKSSKENKDILESSRMFHDPTQRHLAGCQLFFYQKIMKNKEIMDENEVKRLFESDKEQAGEGIMADSENSEATVEFIERNNNLTYIYRFPDDPARCHRFPVFTNTMERQIVQCSSCYAGYARLRKQGKTPLPNMWHYKHEGPRMLEDPMSNHLEGCQGYLCVDIYSNHRILLDDDIPDDKHGFALITAQKNQTCKIVYRLENNPNRCYKFTIVNRSRLKIRLACSKCKEITGPISAENSHFYHISATKFVSDASIFLDDPLLNHKDGCEPLKYKTMMEKYNVADESTARNFLKFDDSQNNEFASTLPPQITGENLILKNSKDDYPFHFLETRKKEVFYAYRLPEDMERCYIFLARARHISVSLSCGSCTNIHRQSKGAAVIARKTDGHSLKFDPGADHLEGCQPDFYEKILEKNSILEDNPDQQQRYEFALVRLQRIRNLPVLFVLRDEPSMCYRFSFWRFNKCRSSILFSVRCYSCTHIRELGIRRKEKRLVVRQYLCNSSGFLSDPRKDHLDGCQPLLYDDVMQNCQLADDTKINNFNARGSIECKAMFCNETKIEMMLTGKSRRNPNIEETEAEKLINYSTNEALNIPATANIAEEEILIDEETRQDCDDISHPERDYNVSLPINEFGMEIQEDLKPNLATRSLVFSHTFDIPMFSADEVNLRLDGRTIYVECEREVSALGVKGGTLVYSMELPEFVDISTINSKWTGEELELTA